MQPESLASAHPLETPSRLTTLSRRSLKEAAVEQIRAAVTQGELTAGQRITELGLAKRLGVGQATIREALIELEHQGFIQRSAVRKTFVTSLGRRQIDEIYVIRKRLETLAVELLIAAKVTRLVDAERECEKMVEFARYGDVARFGEADLDFHRALWRATGNQKFAEVLEPLVPKVFALGFIQHVHPSPEHLLQLAERHRQLLQVILAGEEEPAKALMEAAMEQAWAEDSSVAEGAERRQAENGMTLQHAAPRDRQG
jgi:DNA-binding GntR family transcriptional regulator